MKKYTLPIIGFAIQFVGIGLMLYGINNNRISLWIGFPLLFVGMALVIIGIMSNRKTK
ncbi:MAG: hypothetical protein JKY48_07040 [Flavobacteriales bacterium]|nr:hypothetical protein [Flavobacteriales bacterium]